VSAKIFRSYRIIGQMCRKVVDHRGWIGIEMILDLYKVSEKRKEIRYEQADHNLKQGL